MWPILATQATAPAASRPRPAPATGPDRAARRRGCAAWPRSGSRRRRTKATPYICSGRPECPLGDAGDHGHQQAAEEADEQRMHRRAAEDELAGGRVDQALRREQGEGHRQPRGTDEQHRQQAGHARTARGTARPPAPDRAAGQHQQRQVGQPQPRPLAVDQFHTDVHHAQRPHRAQPPQRPPGLVAGHRIAGEEREHAVGDGHVHRQQQAEAAELDARVGPAGRRAEDEGQEHRHAQPTQYQRRKARARVPGCGPSRRPATGRGCTAPRSSRPAPSTGRRSGRLPSRRRRAGSPAARPSRPGRPARNASAPGQAGPSSAGTPSAGSRTRSWAAPGTASGTRAASPAGSRSPAWSTGRSAPTAATASTTASPAARSTRR